MDKLLESYTKFLNGNEELAKKTLETFEKEYHIKKEEEAKKQEEATLKRKAGAFDKIIEEYHKK